jgi:hypothetical protein
LSLRFSLLVVPFSSLVFARSATIYDVELEIFTVGFAGPCPAPMSCWASTGDLSDQRLYQPDHSQRMVSLTLLSFLHLQVLLAQKKAYGAAFQPAGVREQKPAEALRLERKAKTHLSSI